MNALAPVGKRRPLDIAALLARGLLGCLFFHLGLSNALHAAEFLQVVRQQFMVTSPVVSSVIATTVPWLEVLYGLVLVTGIGLEAAAVVGRWWLGAVFIYMGLNKALPHPEYFLKLVREYHIVSNPFLLNSIAAALPWFEVYCGLLLLLGVAVRGSGLVIASMLVPFTLMVVRRALDIAAAQAIPFCAVKFDCGCGAGEVVICHKVMENAVLLLLAAWMLTGRGRALCLRFALFPKQSDNPTQQPARACLKKGRLGGRASSRALTSPPFQ
jgi:uncharacterized membrane protein YphA (DoxX/SURF4 family)